MKGKKNYNIMRHIIKYNRRSKVSKLPGILLPGSDQCFLLFHSLLNIYGSFQNRPHLPISVPFLMWLCSSFHIKSQSVSPCLEPGFGQCLTVASRMWQRWRHAVSKPKPQDPCMLPLTLSEPCFSLWIMNKPRLLEDERHMKQGRVNPLPESRPHRGDSKATHPTPSWPKVYVGAQRD